MDASRVVVRAAEGDENGEAARVKVDVVLCSRGYRRTRSLAYVSCMANFSLGERRAHLEKRLCIRLPCKESASHRSCRRSGAFGLMSLGEGPAE